MTVQAALAGKKNEKKNAKKFVFKVFIPLSEDDVIIIPTGKCNIACFVVKLIKTICNSLVLCLSTKMWTKKTLDRQVSLKQPEDSNLPDDM